MPSFDLEQGDVRALNKHLHNLPTDTNETEWTITNPLGRHAIATGLDIAINLEVDEPEYFKEALEKDYFCKFK